MEIPYEKYSDQNFHTWKVKLQMQLINKNLWEIVEGTEQSPTNSNKNMEW